MNIFNRKSIAEDHSVKKTFNYTKDGVNLSFTLRIDIKSELTHFKELLEKALDDVIEEIKKLDSPKVN